MILHYLVITNFRQFHDRNEVHFARDAEKNVTVLLGENAAGKTTFLTALAWCFHGAKDETRDKGAVILWNLDKPEQLLNTRALGETPDGERVRVSVELHYAHAKRIYRAVREIEYTKPGGGLPLQVERKRGLKLDYREVHEPGDQWHAVGNPIDEINRVLPLSLVPFFFFKGETAGRWVDPRQTSKLREAVKNILDLTILERTKEHSAGVRKDLAKDLRAVSDDSGVDLEEQITKATERVKRETDKLERKLEERDSLVEDIQLAEEAMAEYAEVQPLFERRSSLRGVREELLETCEEDETKLAAAVSDRAFRALLRPALVHVQAKLKAAYDNEELPARFKSGFVKTLFERGTCICGTDISENTPTREHVIEFSETSGLDLVAEPLQILKGWVDTSIDRGDEFRADFARDYESYERTLVKLSDTERELAQIGTKLLNRRSDEVDLDQLLQAQRKRRDAHVRLESEIEAHERRLGDESLPGDGTLRFALDELEKQRKARHRNNRKARRLTRQLEALDKIKTAAETLQNRWLEIVQRYLDDKIQDVYDQLSPLPRQISFNADYELKMKELADGYWVNSEPSDANQVVLALCFVAGIVELAEKVAVDESHPGGELLATARYPMVMDAPFAKMGIDYASKVPQYLARSVPQMIIMIKDNEWRGEVEAALAHHVGNAYVLKLHSSHSASSRRTFLGREIDYVVNDSKANPDYSRIEKIEGVLA